MPRYPRILTLAVLMLGFVPSLAAADGLPVPVDGSALRAGILDPEKNLRYHATTVGKRTAVLAVDAQSGELSGQVSVPGRFAIPAVAVDGTPSGLAADGSRLVTIRPRERFPRRQTELAIFEVPQARTIRPDPIRPRIVLEGDFSFDAISPDGDTIYLVEYLDRRDPTEYQVRALDVATGELDPRPILDPEEEPGEMRGYPMTRATSPDGEWEYTLYDGGGGEPFIHALDVERGRTVCIDLPQLDPTDAYRATLSMSADGQSITVATDATRREPAATVALVETRTHEASDPPAPDGATAELGAAASDGATSDGPPVLVFAALGLAGVALVTGAWLLLRGGRGTELPVDPFGPQTREEPRDARDRAPVP